MIFVATAGKFSCTDSHMNYCCRSGGRLNQREGNDGGNKEGLAVHGKPLEEEPTAITDLLAKTKIRELVLPTRVGLPRGPSHARLGYMWVSGGKRRQSAVRHHRSLDK